MKTAITWHGKKEIVFQDHKEVLKILEDHLWIEDNDITGTIHDTEFGRKLAAKMGYVIVEDEKS